MTIAETFAPDMRTLAVLVALCVLLATAVYTGLWVQGTGGSPARDWGVAHGLGAVAYGLLSLQGVAPHWLAVTLANSLIVAGGLGLVKGVYSHLQRRYPWRAALAGLAVFVAAFGYFTHIQPDIVVRTALVTGAGAAALLWGAGVLLVQPRAQRQGIHVYTALAFGVVAAVQLARFQGAWAGGMRGELMGASALQAYGVAVVLLGVVAWTLGFFWMIAQQLRQELAQEIASRQAADQSLREREQRFRAIFDTAATGIAFGDREGNIIQANRAFAQLVERSQDELLGTNFLTLTHPDDAAAEMRWVQHLLHSDDDSYRLEKRYLRPDGTPVWVDATISAIRNDAGTPLYFVGVVNDIEARIARQAELEEQATFDPLTGVVNRRRFHELLAQECARSARYGTPASLIMVDIDHFKSINDRYGHEAGDRVLREITARLRGILRDSDVMGRWGGEEFLVLAPETAGAGARGLADKLRRAVATMELDELPPITISLGVTEVDPGDRVERAVARADRALYEAKGAGRNTVVGLGPHDTAGSASA